MRDNHFVRGFTLLELSIVLIISGLMLVGAIEAYQIYSEKQNLENTKSQLADIDQYIKDFPNIIDPVTADPNTGLGGTVYGRLPCPDANSDGIEDCAMATIRGRQYDGAPNGPNVMIGTIPYGTLGLAIDYATDPYGNNMIYAITQSATQKTNYSSGIGALQVTEYSNDDALKATHNTIQYITISAGSSGCNGAGKDIENCDGDADFVAAYHNSNYSNGNAYDDRLAYHAQVPTLIDTGEPAGCEQHDSFVTYADECPKGWDSIDSSSFPDPSKTRFMNVNTTKSSSAGYNPYNSGGNATHHLGSKQGSGQYYNIDEKTGDYYLSDNPLEETVHRPQPNKPRTVCSKNKDNTAKTKCHNNIVNTTSSAGALSGDPSMIYKSPAEQKKILKEALPKACPTGWKVINYTTKKVYDGEKDTVQIDSLANVSCSKE